MFCKTFHKLKIMDDREILIHFKIGFTLRFYAYKGLFYIIRLWCKKLKSNFHHFYETFWILIIFSKFNGDQRHNNDNGLQFFFLLYSSISERQKLRIIWSRSEFCFIFIMNFKNCQFVENFQNSSAATLRYKPISKKLFLKSFYFHETSFPPY